MEPRTYPVQKALREGAYVRFEGVLFRASPDQSLPPGATYFASRNTGPHLLTVREHVASTPQNNWSGGYVIARERAYAFNTGECVQVDMVDDADLPAGAKIVDAPPTVTAEDLRALTTPERNAS